MKTITKETAKKYIYATDGKEFSAVFTKKNGERRLMNCKLGVTDGVKGVGRNFDPDEKGLVSVTDVDAVKIVDGEEEKGDFRFINLHTLESLEIQGVEYTITNNKESK